MGTQIQQAFPKIEGHVEDALRNSRVRINLGAVEGIRKLVVFQRRNAGESRDSSDIAGFALVDRVERDYGEAKLLHGFEGVPDSTFLVVTK